MSINMTENMTPVPAWVPVKGDRVVLNREMGRFQHPYQEDKGRWTQKGDEGIVTRAGTNRVMVRFGPNGPGGGSEWFNIDDLIPADPNAPRPRKRGEKPEGDEFIGQDHPGIQWLWDDIAAYAKGRSWCSQYDTLAAELGIPGRKRSYTVGIPLNPADGSTLNSGGNITVRVEAHSREEATRLARAMLEGVTFAPGDTTVVREN